MKSHRLTPHCMPTPPTWPSYTGTSQYVGTSPSGRVMVFVDPTLGAPALQNARDLVNDGDRVMLANDALFGTSNSDSVEVIVFAMGGATDGTGGADHQSCDFTTGGAIEVCAAFGNSPLCSALLEAEVSECSMGGSLCGLSTGEALSRWCAEAVVPNVLDAFATAPTWSDDGMANWVDSIDPTDQNPDSTGCGMAFLSWLQSLGFSLSRIAETMVQGGDGVTLAVVYAGLSGQAASSAWSTFMSAVQALPNGVTSDDPFLGVSPAPGPTPSPTPAPGGPVLSLADAQAALAAGWPTP
jgi:hypothetical protein